MSFLKKVLSPRASGDNETSFTPRSPSMNDMRKRKQGVNDFNICSMGAIEDNEEYQRLKNDPKFMNSPAVANPSAISPKAMSTSPSKNTVWQSVFNPGRNFHENMRAQGSAYWDKVEGGSKEGHATIWDHVLHSDRHRTFDSLDKDKDGFLTADDLHTALGRSEDVKQLIAAADANGDGKIDRSEFQELLKNSTIAR